MVNTLTKCFLHTANATGLPEAFGFPPSVCWNGG